MKILYFSASYCQPCKQMSPLVEELAVVHGFEFAKVDVEEQPELANVYGIRGVPTIVVLNDDSEVVDRRQGALSRSVVEKWFTVMGIE